VHRTVIFVAISKRMYPILRCDAPSHTLAFRVSTNIIGAMHLAQGLN
jgi:hypothetical protein